MRIGISGASGRLGRALVEHLSKQHNVIAFGRSNSDHLWTLGVVPSPSQLNDIDLFIHLAWSLRDRSADYYINVGGTLLLAQAAHAQKVPFLFVSSVAATSNSEYGESKARAETFVLDYLGTVIRIGLVPELNRYEIPRKRILSFYPDFRVKIQTTSFNDLQKVIDDWIHLDRMNFSGNELRTVLSSEVEAKRVFSQNSDLPLPIPLPIIRFLLGICKHFSLRARNLNDALLSVTTNKAKIDGR